MNAVLQAQGLGKKYGRHWALSTSQGYAIQPGQARATWDSSYQAWFLPVPQLALGAELDALVDATPREHGPSAFAAGVGARLRLGRFELGTAVRRCTETGRSRAPSGSSTTGPTRCR